jgi:hypothetical protein
MSFWKFMRRINRCLNPKLQEICKQVLQLEELSQMINAYLPEFLRLQCHIGSFHKGCLLLIANDSVWAAQLRYSLPELRDNLRQGGLHQLTSIKISIGQELQSSTHRPAVQNNSISIKARNSILSEAEKCGYLPLKEALNRLAQKPLKC